jgi:hypothetical protein
MHLVSGNSLFLFNFWGSSEGRGRAAPVWRVFELKRTGARSAQARTRGQNPLVKYNCQTLISNLLKLTKKNAPKKS